MGKDLQVPSRKPLKIHLPDNIAHLQLYFEGYVLADCVDFELFHVLINLTEDQVIWLREDDLCDFDSVALFDQDCCLVER